MMWKIVLPFFAAFLSVVLGQLPGGAININANDPDFQRAVDVAVREFSSNPYLSHYYALVEVLMAQYEEGQGIYIMTLVLGKTTCIKGVLSIDCPIIRGSPEAEFYTCSFSVWSRDNNFILTGSSCY